MLKCNLNGFVCSDNVEAIIQMMQTNPEEDIELAIDSVGGEVFSGMRLVRAIQDHKGAVVAKCGLLAASIAGVIALCADKMTCDRTSFMMLHAPWCEAFGSASELREQADQLDLAAETIKSLVKNRVKDKEQVDAWFGMGEKWFNAAAMAEHFNAEITDNHSTVIYNAADLAKLHDVPQDLLDEMQNRKTQAEEQSKLMAWARGLGNV